MKKNKLRGMSFLLAGLMAAGVAVGGIAPGIVHAAGKFPGYVVDGDLGNNSTEAPAAWGAVPDANQYKYQKDELAAFCHFGPNTFNEVEWGEHYGSKTPDQIFKLRDDFDAEKLITSIKDAGFKKIIVTAKHHDGFCIWASDYTTYDVAETSYKNGQGDILAEISEACTKHDLDMGLYLSPWDIHEPSYGYYDQNGNPTNKENDYLDYNEYYNNQLNEILSSPKYGNDGHFVEVWMDGAKGSGANAQEYDFRKWFSTIQKYEGKAAGFEADCMLFGSGAYTTVRWIGNESGYANEETWSKSKVDYDNNTIDSNSKGSYTIGYREGNQWTVPECDGRITSGWFWGNNKKTPKSISDLAGMYFNSVGHNAPMLLNIPPNDKGSVDDAILARVKEFGDNIKETFQTNLAAGAEVYASEVRGNDTAYKPSNVLDGNDNTYWTMNDDTQTGSLILDLGKTKTFDVVSIEEAIQYGQRIQSFKIEYRNSDTDDWKTFDQGTTIGAKRLSRKGAVKGSQIRITVTSKPGTDGTPAVPMLSEVGVYKASAGFELAGNAPDGMEVIDISDTDVSDGTGFTFGTGWNSETGAQYVEGTNKWANAGAEFTLHFHGTQAHLIGTKDPGHGQADIYIDGEFKKTIDTSAGSRSVGQRIYTTDELSDGNHTIRLVAKTKAIGIEAAYVLNNGGAGQLELEKTAYTMNEDSTLTVKISRAGGSKGEVEVLVQPNPGTAIQDDFVTEPVKVTFAQGQTEAQAEIKTKRNTNKTGDLYFTIELAEPTNGAIVGFNGKAKITIIDAEGATVEKLQTLIEECRTILKDHIVSGWDNLQEKIAAAQAVVDDDGATSSQVKTAYEALQTAKEALQYRTAYSVEDPFVFPWTEGSSSILEAEFFTLHNTGENEAYPLAIKEKSWASNGKIVNALNKGDKISLPYLAEKAGKYKVTVTFRSGDPQNSFSWTEENGKIKAGSQVAGAGDGANATHTETFELEVLTAGPGKLVIAAGDRNGPQLDKFDIEPVDIALEDYKITANVQGEGGTISPAGETIVKEGNSQTYKIQPAEGYVIKDVLVNGASVGAVESYTFAKVSADATITAVFEFHNYTAANPYIFPEVTGESKELEAEHFILTNTGVNEQYPLEIKAADWASNGKFVNSLNSGDKITLFYRAEKAGKYKVTVTFRSGDPQNSFSWTEENGKIQAGSKVAGASDPKYTHTETFELNVVTPGDGTLVFTTGERKAPQLDKFELVLQEDEAVVSVEKLRALIEECSSITKEYVASGWDELQEKLTAAWEVANDTGATNAQVKTAYDDLLAAKEALQFRTAYTETDPYVFPSTVGVPSILEAEFFTLHNAGENEQWPLQISENTWASNGKFVNALDKGDKISLPYFAAKAGKYKVTLTYRSGDSNNSFSWSEDSGNIEPGSKVAGADDRAQVTHTETFELKVVTPGAGRLVIAAGEKNAPQMDKFELVLVEEGGASVVDKTALKAAIARAEEKLAEQGKYTQETVDVLEAALDAAIAVARNDAATEEDVEAALDDLNGAIAALKEKQAPKPDKTPLKAAIARAEEKLAEEDKYTQETVDVLEAALDAAIAVARNDAATEEDVEAALDDLNGAIAALKEKQAPKPDKTPLKAAIARAEEKLAEEDKYTQETVDVLEAALDAAIVVARNDAATEEDVQAALEALNKAIEGLEEKQDPKPDKTALNAAIAEAEAKLAEEDKYTQETRDALQNAFNAAKAVAGNDDATEEEVQAALDALNEAIMGLKEIQEETPDDKEQSGGNTDGSQSTGSKDKDSRSSEDGKAKPVKAVGLAAEKKSVNTGDNTPVILMAVICLLAGATAILIISKKKRS